MDSSLLVTTGGALLGVLLGGSLSLWGQRLTVATTSRRDSLTDQTNACIALLTAIRLFRLFLMYGDLSLEVVAGDERSRGMVAVDGRAEHDARVHEAYSRVLIVVEADKVRLASREMLDTLDAFIRVRSQYERGRIPDEVVAEAREAELRYAAIVRKNFSR